MAKVSAVPSYLFILESINDAVIVIALNGKILFCNAAAQHLFGYTREEMIGQDIDIFIPKNKAHEREKLVEHVLWGERVENFETQRLHKDKHLIDVSISLSPLKDEDGKTIGTTAVIRHIGAKKHAEGKFQAILESAPDAMVVVNKFGQIILINSQTEKLFGYKPEQIVGQEIEILIPDRYAEQHPFHREAFFKDPKAREMGVGLQLSGKKSNGEEFPVEITLSPLETEGGVLVCAAIRDITERKKAEEILRQSEEKFTKAFELSPAGIIMSNVITGEIVAVNDRLLSIIGYERAEVIGHSTVELKLISSDVRKKIMVELERVGFMDNQEIVFRRKTGEQGIALFSMLLITLNGEKVAFSMYYDITERKKAEAALKQKSDELARSNRELEQFAYVISHDLQAPLRSISSYIGLVKKKLDGTLEGQIKEMFDVVVRASTGMKAMIEDLLNYSRIGKMERQAEPVDLNDILAEIRADLDLDVKQSRAMIVASRLPVIRGNSTELKQLFENLLSNAIKFRKKDVRPEVTVHCTAKPTEWEFSVCDNGIGIPEEYFQKLFIVFQRLHGPGEYPGTGIGLATCKKIVDLLGGKIWLTSKVDAGTTFYFTIPKQITAPALEAHGKLGNNNHQTDSAKAKKRGLP